MRGVHVRRVGGRWMGEYEAGLPGQPRRRRSAGVFDDEQSAVSAAVIMRRKVLDGENVESRWTPNTTVGEFKDYFLRTALIGGRTRGDYSSALDNYILPRFDSTPFKGLDSPAYKEWRSALIERGVPDPTIRKAKFVFSALVTAAAEEGCIKENALRILKVRRTRRRRIDILTVPQFGLLLDKLETEARRLYLELGLELGARPGEMLALCPAQVTPARFAVTINRAVAVPGTKWSLSGDRFDINPYPKDEEERTVTVAPDLMMRLWAVIISNDLGPKDIIFNPTVMGLRQDREPIVVVLGEEFVAANGRCYQHGRNSAYTLGKCRCGLCSAAHTAAARTWRAAAPKGRRRSAEVDIMAPESWRRVFYRALVAADIGLKPGQVTPRHMRHTHVSWRLSRGENVIDVMGDVGHSDLSVTKLYRVQTEDAPRLRLVT